MGDDVTVSGIKLPIAALLGILTFTFWLGGLSLAVTSMADEQKKHEAEPAHVEAGIATAKIQENVEHNTKEIEKTNKKLDDLDKKIDDNQKELLKALRE